MAMTMTPWVDCSSHMLDHPKPTNTPTPERVRRYLGFHKKHYPSIKTSGAGEVSDGGADVEPEGPRHRQDLLAVHGVQLLQQVCQVEQVQGGEACDEAPHGQAKAGKEGGCTASTKRGEEGGE